jgi:hypothetical protein
VILFVASIRWTGERAPAGAKRWTAVKTTTFNRVMLVDVDAQDVREARAIAAEVVETVRDDYDEVLVYVRAPRSGKAPPARRVQWTPKGGYSEMILTP